MQLACSAVLLLAMAAPAFSQDEMDPVQRIEQIYQEARASYEDLDTERARSQLRTALRLADAQGLEHRSLARIHLLLGVISFAETRQEAAAEEEFVAALSFDRGVTIEPSLTSPTLEQILQRARERLSPSPPPMVAAPPLPPPALPPPVVPPPVVQAVPPPIVGVQINHRRVARAYERVNIPIFVEVEGASSTQRIVLRYRRPGGPWNEVDLISQTGDGASGYVPGSAVVGDWIEYYIEAVDWTGRPMAQVGSDGLPHRVSIVQARMPGMEEATPTPWSSGGATEALRRWVHFLFGVGTGTGIAKGPPKRQPEVMIDDGFAPTPFHFYAELGVLPARSFLLLLAGRLEMIVEPEQVIPVPLLSLRGRWFFDDREPVRAFVGAGGGWCGFIEGCGYVEHLVNLRPVQDTTDTTREGNAHAGAEAGLIFDLSPHVGLELDLFLYALFPEKSTFQADLNAGLVFSF